MSVVLHVGSRFSPVRWLASLRLDRAALNDLAAHIVLQGLFWWGVLHLIELPGLYMDAVNPEFLAAKWFHPQLANPLPVMPTATIPWLGNLYHGVENLYVGLLVFCVMGLNLTALRVAQALFGAGIVALTYGVARRTGVNRLLSFSAAAFLATDVAFIASFRTQFYIVLAGLFWLLGALYLLVSTRTDESSLWRYVGAGVLCGLAVYGYFVYLFFLPVMVWLMPRRRAVWRGWITGFVVGMLPYVAGYLSLMKAVGGVSQGLQWIHNQVVGLAPLASDLTLWGRVTNSIRNTVYAAENIANELMIFGAAAPDPWVNVKSQVLLGLVALALAQAVYARRWLGARPQLSGQQLVWLPVCYFVATIALGNRLWIHHFGMLLPLAYLVAAIGLQTALAWAARHWHPTQSASRLVLTLVLLPVAVMAVLGNLGQQDRFFQRLESTVAWARCRTRSIVWPVTPWSGTTSACTFSPSGDFPCPLCFSPATRCRLPQT